MDRARETEQEEIVSGTANGVGRWEDALRTACLTLSMAPAAGISAVSVTVPLNGVPGEAREAMKLSKRLADGHGFQALFELEGHALTVRFRRHEKGHNWATQP